MNIPNAISLARLFAVPVTIWLIVAGHMQVAFWMFIGAGLSDAVDGFLAKRLGHETTLGRYLDPLADKALLVSIYVALGWHDHLPAWLVILVVSRDILIVGGAMLSFLMSQPFVFTVSKISKANTAAQIALAALVLAQVGFSFSLPDTTFAAILLVALTTAASGAGYVAAWIRGVGPEQVEP